MLRRHKTVDATYKGKCMVWREPNYNEGTYNAPEPHYVYCEDCDGQPMYVRGEPLARVFANYADAKEYVDGYYNADSEYDGIRACNVLSHGQYAADTLTIVRA